MKMYLLFQMLLGFQLTALKLTFILAEWRIFFYRFHEIDIFGHFKNKKPISKVIPDFQKVKRTSLLSTLNVGWLVFDYISTIKVKGSMDKRNVYASLTS